MAKIRSLATYYVTFVLFKKIIDLDSAIIKFIFTNPFKVFAWNHLGIYVQCDQMKY